MNIKAGALMDTSNISEDQKLTEFRKQLKQIEDEARGLQSDVNKRTTEEKIKKAKNEIAST